MKKLLFLLLFLSLNTFSQGLFNSYQEGKIILRNNTEITGLVKISGNKIKFKKTKDDKKVIYSSKKAKSLKFKEGSEYHYKIKGPNVLLLEGFITEEKLNLFTRETTSAPMMSSNGLMMGGGITYTTFYVSKKGSDLVEELPKNEKGKRFRKIISKYVSDCQGFSEYIKDKKSIKKHFKNKDNIITINLINYYNKNCTKK